MATSRYNHNPDPDGDADLDADARPVWHPDPPWEPEREPTPWSDREQDDDLDFADLPDDDCVPPKARARPRPAMPSPVDGEPGAALAYLAVFAVLLVSFGLGVLTVGVQLRLPATRFFLAGGSIVVLVGLAMLATAAWFTRRRPQPRG